jgi:hypothetical protein
MGINMGGKVIHINNEAHLKGMEYCKKYNITLKSLVESLIMQAVNKAIPPLAEVVKKKPLPRMIASHHDPENPPESLPPFWEEDASN